MDIQTRQRYLKLMGIDTYALREDVSISHYAVLEPVEHTEQTEQVEQDKSPSQPNSERDPVQASVQKMPMAEDSRVNTSAETDAASITGLEALTANSANGLLVVLAEDNKDLSTEARVLLSKMLKGIDYQAKETAFAVTATQSIEKPVLIATLNGILVFGKSAGDHMVKVSGARRVAGEDFFDLSGLPLVTTVHPGEILDTPALKARAWADLKLIARLMND